MTSEKVKMIKSQQMLISAAFDLGNFQAMTHTASIKVVMVCAKIKAKHDSTFPISAMGSGLFAFWWCLGVKHKPDCRPLVAGNR